MGVLLLGLCARRMLSALERTWSQSKRAVQAQKESFEVLVDAFYPRFATEKLLAGECPIVVQAPEVHVPGQCALK